MFAVHHRLFHGPQPALHSHLQTAPPLLASPYQLPTAPTLCAHMPALQFTTGYSMVLNLLYTRTLEEARAFLDRSFAAYLGGQGVQVGYFCLLLLYQLPSWTAPSPPTLEDKECRLVCYCLCPFAAVPIPSWTAPSPLPGRPGLAGSFIPA